MYNNDKMLDGELAVPCNLQSAIARLMRYLGANLVVFEYALFMMKLGSYSIVTCEPCQGRNAAALSGNTMCFKVALVE